MSESRVNSIGRWARLLRWPWFSIGVIVLAVSAAYSNSLSGSFIHDDLKSILGNFTIRSLWPISKVLNPPCDGGITVQGRPVVNLSVAINYALGGKAVFGYHLFNLAVHILAALVLFGIVRRTLLLPGRSEHLAGQSTALALATALLWGVHPLTTNAVTYIIQRAESLMALFYLLTVYCVIRSATGKQQRMWEAAAVVACLAGMGCKEVVVSAPLIVLLYDRVFLSRSFRECFQKRGLLYAGLATTWLLLAWLVIPAATRGGSVGFGGGVAWWAYALTQCQAVVTYLKLCCWPHPLVFDYGTDVITDPVKVWPHALLLVILLASVLASSWRQPWIGFLGVCFLALLAPSSSVVPVITDTMAERRMYLPLTIVVALTVLLVHRGWQRIWTGREQDRQRWRRAPALALLVTATMLGGLTFRRNQDYRTELAIWTDTVNKLPNSARAIHNRGHARLGLGESVQAIADFSQAINLKPDYSDAYNNRGAAYQQMGQIQQALADFNQAIELKPRDPTAYNNRGVIYRNLGRLREALEDFTQAVAVKPDYADAYFNRGTLYNSLGQFQLALADYTQAITLRPDDVDAYNSRGTTYQSLGQWDQAIKDFTEAIALKPDFATAYYNRANTCQSLGQLRQALADYTQAIALQPDSFQPYINRGNTYQRLGQRQQAIEDYSRAIQLKPSHHVAYVNRAMVFYDLKQYDRAWADVAKAKELGYTPPAEFLRMLSEASGRAQN